MKVKRTESLMQVNWKLGLYLVNWTGLFSDLGQAVTGELNMTESCKESFQLRALLLLHAEYTGHSFFENMEVL